jgi:hypothetical protein
MDEEGRVMDVVGVVEDLFQVSSASVGTIAVELPCNSV